MSHSLYWYSNNVDLSSPSVHGMYQLKTSIPITDHLGIMNPTVLNAM